MDKLNIEMVVEVFIDGEKVLSRQDDGTLVLVKNMEVINDGTTIQHNLQK